jgi:hypothetical protein
VFFVQNAGAKDAGTGLHKSAIIEKISLADAAAVSNKSDAAGLVKVTTVPSSPMVINPNGEKLFHSKFFAMVYFLLIIINRREQLPGRNHHHR